ncbi:hypothetical protein DYB26_007058 [Aphanomyces astaci]|uniref:PUM-HD domain-containing protein n=2 Tax=Aphanomyces astaci TaxID=112090 RepID=A0A397AX29_APHAT|nr:hypothetical protein DYB36_004319 [Aphanomyces astaci]RHY70724.1 hypothetical protein DYB34_001713 [Aphanomyces astaci]RHZ30568.1 hypothetical protein DYB26_007058 [Aphanomyces astaci]
MSVYEARPPSNNSCMKKQDMFDLSMLGTPSASSMSQPQPEDDDGSIGMNNFAIGSRIQRSMSAPPIAENVGRLPPPMYAQSEYDESQLDPNMSPPEYYYYYAPKSHNPRFPISYNNWEAMQRQHHARQPTTSTLHRVQISERRRGDSEESTDSQASVSSNRDFEAAVAAAGGHSVHQFANNQMPDQRLPYCLSPTESSDSNSSTSYRPLSKTLIDRIQEDFPRTPSPVFDYPPTSNKMMDDAHAMRYPDLVGRHDSMELPSDMLQRMNMLDVANGGNHDGRFRSKSRGNKLFFPPGTGVFPPPGMIPSQHHHGRYPMYDRYARGGAPVMQCPPSYMHHQYQDSYDHNSVRGPSHPDIRLLSRCADYGHDHASSSSYNDRRHYDLGQVEYPSSRMNPPRGAASWEVHVSDHHRGDQMGNQASHHSPRNHIHAAPPPSVLLRAKAKPATPVAPQPKRSALMDDFECRSKATAKPSKWELVEARGHLVEFAKDQDGSRFIQLKLESATPDIKDIVFSEIAPVALQLMTDVFGNYVIQKFFDHGNAHHITQILRVIQGNMLDLAMHMYGCRVIQKALEATDDLPLKLDLICELQGHVLHCIKDQNGNHVVQKVIEILPWKAVPSSAAMMPRAAFLLESFVNNVYTMSTHPYGCRVIQRVLEKCSELQMAPMLCEIQDAYGLLVNDQYGNYVIQHVLKHGPPSERAALINRIYPDIVRLSHHKYASNVIEKCLLYASVGQLRVIMQHILSTDHGECPLQVMMKDQYANYVVQKLIDVADANERDKMAAIIKTHAAHLKRYTHGKHILNRLENLTGHKIT